MFLVRCCFLGLSLVACCQSAVAKPVNVVTFNVENLFDTIDDPTNPRDDTYLPRSVKDSRPGHAAKCDELNRSDFFRKQCKELDWSEAVYSAKLERIADVLLSLPALPDVIVIPETENRMVLEDLVSRHLGNVGFKIIQLDTSDKPESRGIDVGILTRLDVVDTPKAHVIDFGKDQALCGPTRDIVEAKLRLPDGDVLTVFGVHLPSGSNPFRCRVRAFKSLNDLSKQVAPGKLVLAAGDFNINCNETTSPAFERLLFRGNWYVSPVALVGCTAPGSSKFVDRINDNWHTWSFLDLILVRQELSPSKPSDKNWFADLGSLSTLVVHPEQVRVDENNKGYIAPRRFDPETQKGVSDHWPIGIRLLNRRDVAGLQPEIAEQSAPLAQAPKFVPQQTIETRRDLRWLRRSAEYAVIVQQSYRLAESNLTTLLQNHAPSEPWVVVMDADETILDNSQGEFRSLPKPADAEFNPGAWRQWVSEEKAGAIPGARAFLQRVISMGGKIAVITNRDHDQDHHTRKNLKAIGIDFPADELCVLGRSKADRYENNKKEWDQYGYRNDKDKRRRQVSLGQAERCWTNLSREADSEAAQAAWSRPYRLMMFVGDNIKDFPKVTSAAASNPITMQEISNNPRYIMLPNPTYGSSWEKLRERAVWE